MLKEILGLVVVLAFIGIIIWASWESPQERLRRRAQRADRLLSWEASQARRSMNDAVGQSWRNPFE